MKLLKFAITFAFLAHAMPHAAAQGTDALLTTVGTTVKGTKDHHVAYILWQPGNAEATFGKRFSINRKDGAADSPSQYMRVGMQSLQASPNTIRAMLELGEVVDRWHEAAPGRIDGLYRQVTYQAGEEAAPLAPEVDPDLDVAAKLSYLLASAATDPATLSRLFFLGRAHPGVMIALGHAYQMPLAGGMHTFEIREVDLADNDIRVVGRVTLDTENPVVLDAPSAPVRVSHPIADQSANTVSPKDHLNARFRWGVPISLREQMAHAFGFDLFRVRQDKAEEWGWHLTPPSPQDLLSKLGDMDSDDVDPEVAQVNELPILVSNMLTPAEADDESDTERIDYADDGVLHEGANGQAVRRPYQDGEAFYFFVAARGITGMPGNLSPGTLVVMCDTLPSLPPVVESVLSKFVAPANQAQWQAQGQGGTQFLQVKIRQLPTEPIDEAARGYIIYRWDNPSEYLNHLGDPNFYRLGDLNIGRIGYVDHDPENTFVYFNDNGEDAPTPANHEDRSVWYTARAVGNSSHDNDILSGHSGPVPGFLRDFRAPDAPTGDYLICRHLPMVSYFGRTTDGAEGHVGIAVVAGRISPRIVAAEITVEIGLQDQPLRKVHQQRHRFQHGDILRVNLPYREPTNKDQSMRITVRSVTAHGLVSEEPIVLDVSEVQAPAPLYAGFQFRMDVERQCRPISSVQAPWPVHEAFDADGTRNPIHGSIAFPGNQGVSEWRIYRRIGSDGPLTLVAKAEGSALVSPATWVDESMPSESGVRICYFAQLFDQNANPSPLFPIGCTGLLNPDLPTPMLAPAGVTLADDGENMRVALEWFCDPVGVERFEILIARDGGGIPEPGGLSPLLADTSETVDSDEFGVLSFYKFQTGRVSGPLMGGGPQFSAALTLPADATYFFVVVASGPGGPGARANGAASNVVSASWRAEPGGPQPVIPWPARPLGATFDTRQPIETYATGEGPFWPVALPRDFDKPASILVGVTRHPLLSGKAATVAMLSSPEPPQNYLFRVRDNRRVASSLTDLMPFMLYRYQVPSEVYPNARANIVQCTPLIDRMSWQFVPSDFSPGAYEIRDPYFQFLDRHEQTPFNLPVAGGWTDENAPQLNSQPNQPLNHQPRPAYLEGATGFIFLNDLMPVAQGAKYRHLIVQYDGRGEIKRVIPIEPILIPIEH